MKELEILIDREKGRLFYKNVSSIISEQNDIPNIHQSLRNKIGPTADRLFHKLFKNMIKKYGFLYEGRDETEEDIRKMLQEISYLGYGKLMLSEYNEKILINVENSFDRSFNKRYETRTIIGILEGAFEELLGKKCSCEHVSCENEKSCDYEIEISEEPVEKENNESSYGDYTSVKDLETRHLRYRDGELWYKDTRNIILHVDFISNTIEELGNLLGRGARGIFYEASKYAAIKRINSIKKYRLLTTFSFLFRPLIKKSMEEEYLMRGFGNPEVEVKREKIILDLENCHNCHGIESDSAICYDIQGQVAGVAESMMGSKVICEEEKCIAKGDDFCRYVAKKRNSKL